GARLGESTAQMRYPATATTATRLSAMRTWRTVTTRSTWHPSPSAGDDECWSDAKRAFLLLSGRVGTDRRPDLDESGVDAHVAATDDDCEPVEPTRRRAGLLLAHAVVFG